MRHFSNLNLKDIDFNLLITFVFINYIFNLDISYIYTNLKLFMLWI